MKILGIDLDNVFRTRWEAEQGREQQAAHLSTLRMISEMRDDFDRVVVAADGGPSFRKLKVPYYKGDRQDPGEAYREQRKRTLERLSADGCIVITGPQIEPGGFAEADDVLGWLARAYAAARDEATDAPEWTLRLVSNDGDLEALVSDALRIDLVKPALRSREPWTEHHVKTTRKVTPDKIAHLKALMGDSDGFKGVPGIGKETAAEIVKTCGNALAVFGNVPGTDPPVPWLEFDALPSRARKAIKDLPDAERVVRECLWLATIKADLDLDFDELVAPEPERKPIPETGEYFTARADPPTAPVPQPEPRQEPERKPAAALVRREPDTPAAIVHEASSGLPALTLQPHSLRELHDVSRFMFNSRMYPQFPNVEAIMATIAEARERGIPAGTALRNAYVVKGRLAWSAAFLAGLVMSSGKARVFKIVETTSERAVVRHARTDDRDPPAEFVFTIQEAQRAGWLKSGEKGDGKWLTNPRTMLRWAALREAARAFFPDVVQGMYTPDELRDGTVTEDEFESGGV